jgi:hypothetical protein
MTFQKWALKYRPYPMRNTRSDKSEIPPRSTEYQGKLRSVTDHEVKAKLAEPQGFAHVWTLLQTDGGLYLSPGCHYVNREGYFLCYHAFKEGVRDVRL